MTREWHPVDSQLVHHMGAVSAITHTTPDGVEVTVTAEYPRNSEQLKFSVMTSDGADTDHTAQWPAIERHLPRGAWPHQITDGHSGGNPADADPAVVTWVAEMIAQDEAADDD